MQEKLLFHFRQKFYPFFNERLQRGQIPAQYRHFRKGHIGAKRRNRSQSTVGQLFNINLFELGGKFLQYAIDDFARQIAGATDAVQPVEINLPLDPHFQPRQGPAAQGILLFSRLARLQSAQVVAFIALPALEVQMNRPEGYLRASVAGGGEVGNPEMRFDQLVRALAVRLQGVVHGQIRLEFLPHSDGRGNFNPVVFRPAAFRPVAFVRGGVHQRKLRRQILRRRIGRAVAGLNHLHNLQRFRAAQRYEDFVHQRERRERQGLIPLRPAQMRPAVTQRRQPPKAGDGGVHLRERSGENRRMVPQRHRREVAYIQQLR